MDIDKLELKNRQIEMPLLPGDAPEGDAAGPAAGFPKDLFWIDEFIISSARSPACLTRVRPNRSGSVSPNVSCHAAVRHQVRKLRCGQLRKDSHEAGE